jgi:valyl-tRNA synthetase
MLENIEILKVNKKPHSAISAITEDIDIYVPVSGLIDIEAETKKLGEKINAAKNLILSKETRLKNKEFSRKAPAEIIEKEKDSLLKLKDELRRMERMVDELH